MGEGVRTVVGNWALKFTSGKLTGNGGVSGDRLGFPYRRDPFHDSLLTRGKLQCFRP